MTVKKGYIYEMVVDNVAYGGKGIVKIKNFVIFIENVVPGDIVEGIIIKKNRNYAYARVVKFIEFSKDRVNPICCYSRFCGGCKWQFLNYDQQLFYKYQSIKESIQHIALIKNIKINPVISSSPIFGYRNKMEFSCSDSKFIFTKNGYNKYTEEPTLGLHIPNNFSKIIDISNCLLQPYLGNKILRRLRILMKSSNLSFCNLKNNSGYWRFVVLRNSSFSGKWMVNITTSKNDSNEIFLLAKKLKQEFPEIVSIVNTITTDMVGKKIKKSINNLIGDGVIREKIGDYSFDISVESFFQTNTGAVKKLYDIIKFYADLSGKERVLDLYCGTGSIGIYLSKRARKFVGIEFVNSAIINAKKNCYLNGTDNCDFIFGDVKNELKKITFMPNIVIVDPPRIGMHKNIIKKLLEMTPKKLIYVSCNPATFSRDLFFLKNKYEVEVIQPIDMFPHTFHIELVANLIKKNKFFYFNKID